MRGRVVALVVLSLAMAGAWPATASGAAATCHGRKATIVGSSASEVLTGTQGDDVIAGLGGSDTIDGRGGDDWICGGYGADRLAGGRGSDRVFGGRDGIVVTDEGTERIGDQLRGGPGSDRLVPGRDPRPADDVTNDMIRWDHSSHRMHIDLGTGVATGQGRDRFVPQATWVVGSAFADVVEGGPGRDRVDGGPGPDRISTHRGADRVIGGPGRDRIRTGTGDDQVFAGSSADVVYGGPGDDQLSADAGADRLYGGAGNDTIDNSARSAYAAKMYGGTGRDLLIAQLADVPGQRQVLAGGPGARDQVGLSTTVLNPGALPATGSWDMATGRLVLDFDRPVLATVTGFERADLSTYGAAWSIQGTSGSDGLTAVGTAGTSFVARAGDDSFSGSASDDLFDGGAGTDRSLGMGLGNDTCIAVELFDVSDCETVTP